MGVTSRPLRWSRPKVDDFGLTYHVRIIPPSPFVPTPRLPARNPERWLFAWDRHLVRFPMAISFPINSPFIFFERLLFLIFKSENRRFLISNEFPVFVLFWFFYYSSRLYIVYINSTYAEHLWLIDVKLCFFLFVSLSTKSFLYRWWGSGDIKWHKVAASPR